MSLCEYIDTAMRPQTHDCLGNGKIKLAIVTTIPRKCWFQLLQSYELNQEGKGREGGGGINTS